MTNNARTFAPTEEYRDLGRLLNEPGTNRYVPVQQWAQSQGLDAILQQSVSDNAKTRVAIRWEEEKNGVTKKYELQAIPSDGEFLNLRGVSMVHLRGDYVGGLHSKSSVQQHGGFAVRFDEPYVDYCLEVACASPMQSSFIARELSSLRECLENASPEYYRRKAAPFAFG